MSGRIGIFVPAHQLIPVVTKLFAAFNEEITRLQFHHYAGKHTKLKVFTIHRSDGHVTPMPAGDGFPPRTGTHDTSKVGWVSGAPSITDSRAPRS
jgi:hypothetical protein